MQRKGTALLLILGLVALVVGGVALGVQRVWAGEGTPAAQATASPMHPTYTLLDAQGQPVAQSGQPADLQRTCGQCHDTAFIVTHASHQKAETMPGFEGLTGSCFSCHATQPNDAARREALASGERAWANSAVLAGSGLLDKTAQGWRWNPEAFDAEGQLKPAFVDLHRPTNANCAQCHGVVQSDKTTPLVIDDLEQGARVTRATGQVISPQRIADSGMNIAGKEGLSFAWDVHAERGLQCVDCHASANSPVARRDQSMPSYLTFDPRRPAPGAYLQRPDHRLTQPRCESCHDPQAAHSDWLPYLDLHLAKVACETCHVPQLYAPALESVDRTVVLPNGAEKVTYRGVDPQVPPQAPEGAAAQEPFTVAHQVTGFVPAVLKGPDGKLAPFNLVTTFKWVYEKQGQTYAVRSADLQKAWMPNGEYAPEIVQALDADGNGRLTADEVVLDTPEKVDLIAQRLSALGLANPHIVAEVKAYPIHHSVVQGDRAVGNCQACHSEASRLQATVPLAPQPPAEAQVVFIKPWPAGGQAVREQGGLYYRPAQAADLYLAGRDAIGWIDLIGVLAFLGTLLGVLAHGALRIYFARQHPPHHGPTKREYLYTAAERFWHWLQMAAIVILLVVGLIIHKPQWFGGLSFRGMVFVHTVVGWILVGNFLLALYYFLATDYLKQFIPRPQGLFSRAMRQAQFYIRGIFRGEPHPFKKSFWDKLNPMQRLAYFGLLFGMLPVQMITGVWLWAARIWPQAAHLLGPTTLTWVAAIHTLDAWLIAAFVVGHVYLTTTGASPWEYIKAMITGWEEVEVDQDEVEMA